MSDAPETANLKKRSLGSKLGRGVAWLIGSVLLLIVMLVAGASWYTTTADFQQRVGKQVVSALEDATGGKVDLAKVSFDLWHLAIEADGLVIHGLEGPGEAPYLSADKIQVRIKIVSLLQHTAGGLASHIGLNLLRVEAPHVHLIIDKDGKTNQPVPKHSTPSTEPLQDTLLDLKATEVELVQGLAVVNDKAIPFDLAAQDLAATVRYLPKNDRYGAVIDLRDLRTRMAKEPEAKSSLHIEAEVGRDAAELKAFDFHTGDKSELQASAALNHFAHPEWKANLVGSVELRQIRVLAGVDGLDAGSLELNIAGHNCYIEPAAAQKKPKLIERLRSLREHKQNAQKTLPPDPECQTGYLLVGNAKLHGAGYVTDYVRVHDVNGGALLKITPTQLLFTALTGSLPTGGSVAGDLKIDNWLGEVPANTPPHIADRAGRDDDGEQDGGCSHRAGGDVEQPDRSARSSGSCLSDGEGEPDSAADNHGDCRAEELRRSWVRHLNQRAGERGMGWTCDEHRRHGAGGCQCDPGAGGSGPRAWLPA